MIITALTYAKYMPQIFYSAFFTYVYISLFLLCRHGLQMKSSQKLLGLFSKLILSSKNKSG